MKLHSRTGGLCFIALLIALCSQSFATFKPDLNRKKEIVVTAVEQTVAFATPANQSADIKTALHAPQAVAYMLNNLS